MRYHVTVFSEFQPHELYQVLQLRSEVFVVEQTCIYQDMDGKDLKALHVLGKQHEDLLSYARILTEDQAQGEIAVGRVIVAPSLRGTGEGHRLMAYCLSYVAEHFANPSVRISAQAHLVTFYEIHGFQSTGKNYLEDGIPHCEMLYTPIQ